jgi:DNA-binding response OmpR family regulator
MPASILVAEHLPHATAAIDSLLVKQGYEVRTVLSATQALAVWQERPADIVLSRVTFAESINGVDLAHRLEASGAIVILYSPFPAHLLQRVPGFSATKALYIDTRCGFADLLLAVQAFAEIRAKAGQGNPPVTRKW